MRATLPYSERTRSVLECAASPLRFSASWPARTFPKRRGDAPHSNEGEPLRRWSALAVLFGSLLFATAGHGQVNSWSSPNFGKWETNSNWSLGVAPTNTQTIFITNALSKTVTIDATTAGTTTMTVSNLTVSAPLGSANMLFLNNSGLGTPLRLLNNFTISSRATLFLLGNSVLQMDKLSTVGTFSISDGGFVNLLSGSTLLATNPTVQVWLGNSGTGEMIVDGATLRVRVLGIGGAIGSVGTLTLRAGGLAEMLGDWYLGFPGTTGVAWMTGGELLASNVATEIGYGGSGQFALSNGTMRARTIEVAFSGRGTLTQAGGTINSGIGVTSENALMLGGTANSTGTVWMTAGRMFTTNASTVIGQSGVGRLTLSNGTIHAGTVTLSQLPGSAGTLTIVGGTFTADQLVATNINSPITFIGGDMTLRGAQVANNLVFQMAADRTAVLNLPAGTNRFDLGMMLGLSGSATAMVWITGGHLIVTNGTTTIGDTSFGKITLSNGSWRARDVKLGRNFLSTGVLAVAGGTNQLTTDLRLGSDVGSTGLVWLTGGELIVTNGGAYVGDLANGQMTVSNGIYRARDMRVGNAAGSRGTWTVAGGTNIVSTGPYVGFLAGATGTVWLTGGQLISTNDTTTVSLNGVGQMTVSNGAWLAGVFGVANGAGAQGTLTIAGGTSTFLGGFDLGTNPGSTGTLWMTGGELTATNSGEARLGSMGTGHLILSNGQLRLGIAYVGLFGTGRGTMTMAGGTNIISSLLSVAATAGGSGTVWLTGGQLVTTNVNTSIGASGVGRMAVSNGAWLASNVVVGQGTLTVAGGVVSADRLVATNSSSRVELFGGVTTLRGAEVANGQFFLVGGTGQSATLNLVAGTNKFDSLLLIGSDNTSTGAVWMTGGLLSVTNGLYVCVTGVGQMTVSNGTWNAGYVTIGDSPSSRGTLTLAGGTTTISNQLTVAGDGGTHAVWLTGGQLTTTGMPAVIGSFGIARMTVSNGTWRARHVIIGASTSAEGSLTVAGGVSSVYSNLTIGTSNCGATDVVTVTAGALRVTNNATTAVLELRGGTLIQSGGTLDVDRLVITNACGRFVRTGGTFIYGTIVLDPALDADGDGIPNGWEQLHSLDPFNPADENLDSDGDGMTNLQEYLAGTDPNNSASAFRITSVLRVSNNVRVTWTTVGGTTSRVQVATSTGGGSFIGEFNNLSSFFIIPGFGESTTNYLDVGGATNVPSRYYRIRMIP